MYRAINIIFSMQQIEKKLCKRRKAKEQRSQPANDYDTGLVWVVAGKIFCDCFVVWSLQLGTFERF